MGSCHSMVVAVEGIKTARVAYLKRQKALVM